MAKPTVWALGALYCGALVAAILSTQGAWRDLVCGANSLAMLGWVFWQRRAVGEPLTGGVRWLALAAALLLLAGLVETAPLALRG